MKLIREDTSFTITDFKRVNKYQYTKYSRDDDHGPRTYQVGEKKVDWIQKAMLTGMGALALTLIAILFKLK